MDIDKFLSLLGTEIVNPIINLMFAFAVIYFLWGVYIYIKNAEKPEERSTGQKHIIWGIVGLVIMVSVFSILKIATGTFF